MENERLRLLKSFYLQVLCVILSFVTMVLVSNFYVSRIVQRQMSDYSTATISSAEHEVRAILSRYEVTLDSFAFSTEHMINNDASQDEILKMFTEWTDWLEASDLEHYWGFSGVYGYIRGEFLDGTGWEPPDDYVPQTRPWYTGAADAASEMHYTTPYIDADTGEVVISISKQLVDENANNAGVISMDININHVVNYISSLSIANEGYGVLLNEEMTFVVYADERLIGVSIMEAGNGENYAEIGRMLAAGQPVSRVRFINTNNVESVAYFRELFNHWYIGIVIPISEYTKSVSQLTLILSIIGAVLMLVLSSFIILFSVSKSRSEKAKVLMLRQLQDLETETRISANGLEQERSVIISGLQFDLFIKTAENVKQAFRMTQAMLHHKYSSIKTTLVYAAVNETYLSTCRRNADGTLETRQAGHYPHHTQVLKLLEGKQFVFFNRFTLKEHNADFADESTQIACLVPLMVGGSLKGYMIAESSDDEALSVVKEEGFLRNIAQELSGWILAFERTDEPEQEPETEPEPEAAAAVHQHDADNTLPLHKLRGIEGLEFDTALETMGGLEDVYERSVRLFVRLAAETIQKMDDYINTDLSSFAVEIHGMKGSLNTIGAFPLAATAGELENAAKAGRHDDCKNDYLPFRKSLLSLHKGLDTALPAAESAKRPSGDKAQLLDILNKAKEAAGVFDAYEAIGIMEHVKGCTYGEEADMQINEILSLLETYDCETAVIIIDKLIKEQST